MECVICGKYPWSEKHEPSVCLYTGRSRCWRDECLLKAREYAHERDKVMAKYAEEKRRLLQPWKEKLDTELFLLEDKYLWK